MRKGVYVGCFPPDLTLEERFQLAKEAGFEAIEIRGDEDIISSDGRLAELAELSKRTVPITSVMAAVGWRPSLSDPDEATRARAVELFAKTIRAAGRLGAGALLVVPGGVNERVSYAQAWERAAAGIRALVPVAEEHGIQLCVENVWNKFLLSPLEMARFVDDFGSPYVGSYFDVGNVLLYGYPEQWIETLGSRIKRVHLKDFRTSVGNFGGFVQLLEGDVNWPAVMGALRKVGYDGPLTAEVDPYKHLGRKGIFDLASTIGEIIQISGDRSVSESDVAREIAGILLDVGAVAIDIEHPFRYASGILSPIYCDNRLLISYPRERRRIVARLGERLQDRLGREGADVVAGTATSGIPYAAWLSEVLDLPMIYVRAAAKEHGRGKRVEGRLGAGQRVVVVEDLVTTGGSSMSTADGVEEAGGRVVACLAIFSYELPRAAEAFGARRIPLFTLTGLSTLLEVAAESGRVSPERLEEVREGIGRAFAPAS